ncbi:hypothetical protein WJX79_010031 [Trebouxia sp. C0005]
MVDVMTAQTPSEGSSDAQAAAAARKARRKKTRWGADVEPAQGDKGEAQAGSTEIPSVTSVPGSVFAANAPPQQELTSLKLNSSVPSGTPVHSQPSSASVSGQNAAFSTSVSSQGQPPPWLAKGQTELANGNVDTPPVKDAEVLPGPPPQPNAQQPWLPQSAPAAHPNGAHPMHSAPPGAAYQGYGAEYYFQHPGGYPVSHLHPAGVKPAADDDRPPGVEGEDGDEALPGEEPAATPPAAALSGAPADRDREPVQHERKRRTQSRWRDNDDREIEGELKASKRRRASPGFEPRLRTSPVFEPWQRASPGFEPRAKGPLRRSPSMSPAFREPLMHRSPPRRRPPVREPSPERPRVRRPRGYRRKASSLSASPARYTPQPPQEHEPQPAPKPQPTEEEKAAAEAEAAVAAREATPEVSEEGEIPVDPEEMEVLSKAQQQPAPKIGHQHSPTRRHTSDRGRDRAPDRDRGPPGRDRYSGAGGRGERSERRRGRGRGGPQHGAADFNRGAYDRSNRPRDSYPVRPPPGLAAPPMFAQFQQQQQQYEEYDEYDEAGGYEEPDIYAPQTYDAPYGVYGSALGTAAASGGPYGQYGSYMG